jgi:hypothetical protein
MVRLTAVASASAMSPRGGDFLLGNLVCLFAEPMKQNHKLPIDGEHHPQDPVGHLGANFKEVR